MDGNIHQLIRGKSGTELRLRHALSSDIPAVRSFIIERLRAENIEPDMAGIDPDLREIECKYSGSRGAFFILESMEGSLVGTISVLGLSEDQCELRKMYLADSLRNQGFGSSLLRVAVKYARDQGYRRMCLETASTLVDAIRLYERSGFRRSSGSNSLSTCDLRYELSL